MLKATLRRSGFSARRRSVVQWSAATLLSAVARHVFGQNAPGDPARTVEPPRADAKRAGSKETDAARPGPPQPHAPKDDSLPLQRDKSGRLLAPVSIDADGPFLFVVDTGASRSALSVEVMKRLRLRPEQDGEVYANGATGRAPVRAVRIGHLQMSGLRLEDQLLPVLTSDVLGGADGVLGADGLADHKLEIDLAARRIAITSYADPPPDARTVPLEQRFNGMICIDVSAGSLAAKAIVGTGTTRTLGNPELRRQLEALRKPVHHEPRDDHMSRDEAAIHGVITGPLTSQTALSTPVSIAGLLLGQANVLYADQPIFGAWNLQTTPALLLGMDLLGRARYLAIDYRRSELQIRM